MKNILLLKPDHPWVRIMLTFLLLIIFHGNSYSQERIISGSVSDATTGESLPGVNIIVEGTTSGVVTDIDGKYSIKVANSDAVLIFSMVGYLTEQIPVQGKEKVDVNLVTDIQQLDEVVVVGYGTMKKKLSTGANAHVSNDEMDQKHSLRLEQALQGLTSGVQITSNSGQPGSNFKVRIRGVGTIGNADPLYIVDGVPTGDVSYLSPSDIESVDILKDAASSAIYGAQAANGVVLITTKKGKAGEMHISYDGYYGIQNVIHKVDVLSTREYVMLMDEAYINSNPKYRTNRKYPYNLPFLPQLDANGDIVYGSDGNILIDPSVYDSVKTVYWQDYLFKKNAPVHSHSLSIEGGTEKSMYSASVNYFAQDGIIGTHDQSSYERISARINSETKIFKDIFTFGENITFAHVTSHGIGVGNIYGNNVKSFISTSPTFLPYDDSYPDGFGRSIYPSESNPVANMYYRCQNQTTENKALGNVYLQLSPIKGLKLRTDLGFDVSINENNSFTPVYNLSTLDINQHSTANMSFYRNFKYNWENTINYSFSFRKNNMNILVGNTVRETTRYNTGGAAYDLIIPDFEHAILSNGTNDSLKTNFGSKSEESFLSYFGRVNYNYNEKILFTGVFRRDGSTKFGPSNRFGNFFSFSGGYIITEEAFFQFTWLDFLKIRASWGQNGNDNITPFAYQSLISLSDKNYYFGNPQTKYIGAAPDQIPNASIRWETATMTDIGFDARFLNSITLTFDWYKKFQKDWLVTIRVPELTGILNDNSYPIGNGGDVSNTGVEIALGYQKVIGDFSFSVNGNFSFNKNKVLHIPTVDSIIHGQTGVLYTNFEEFYRAEDGYPLSFFWGYKTNGIFQDSAQISQYTNNDKIIQPNAKPGDVIFQDLNGDGIINSEDKTMIGNPWPKFVYGLSFSSAYKGFDLSFVLQGVYGNDIANGISSMNTLSPNKTADALDRWHGPGTSNRMPRMTDGAEANKNWRNFSDLYIEDGSFLKVRSINFGYDFSTIIPKFIVTQCRLYVSVVNAFTFTKYKGFDPEVGYGDHDYSRYQNMSTGIDLGTYPQSRQFLLGLNLKF
ncbi:MAG: TonB-dependent receptor [Bacteroidales bacterium]|nr:TonB-dependent receptor [Bacteroidales bacterium]